MIAANVAAAKALEAKTAPVVYRVHEPPSREKLVALKDYLKTFGNELALGQVVTPGLFNRIIKTCRRGRDRPQVMEQVLRSQTQAYYGPANHGHFGLALGSYAHFTSPIRRYADLLVHRALVARIASSEGGNRTDEAAGRWSVTRRSSSPISSAARWRPSATRSTAMSPPISRTASASVVECRITGVQTFGFFATVEGLGGDGLVPVATLGDEYFRYDEATQRLVGDEAATSIRSASG